MNSRARGIFWVLSFFGLLVVGAVPVRATNFTATLSGVPTFIPGASPLGGVPGCVFGSPALPRTYTSQTLVTGTAGTYTFTGTGRSSVSIDPFLALYLGVFDPAHPTANLVGCNDDTIPGVNQLPTFSATLGAGATYAVVTTTWGAGSSNGTVSFTVSPDITLVSAPTAPVAVPALGDSATIGLAALLLLAGYATLSSGAKRDFRRSALDHSDPR